jgi:Fe-S-cluster containining protein
LAPDEREAAAAAGLPVVSVADGDGFFQPCPQLGASRCCAIYEVRPNACRRYRCATLRALEAGEIDLPAARSRSHSAQLAIAGLRRGLPDDATVVAIRRDLQQAGDAGDPARWVALAALERLLDRHFRSPEKRVFEPDQAATVTSP